MSTHLINGKFQSDKYPTTPAGKVPLSTGDKMAQDLLWAYAKRRRNIDPQFAADLATALFNDGYIPELNRDPDDRVQELLEANNRLVQEKRDVIDLSKDATQRREASLTVARVALQAFINKRPDAETLAVEAVRYMAQIPTDLLVAVETPTFQRRIDDWMLACFGEEIAADKTERNHRFLEESLELVQSCGCTASEAHQLVDYVFGRPIGEKVQEVGGVMVTLSALCSAHGIDMGTAGETELARIWTKIPEISAKQAAKPKHSPLPEGPAP